MKRKAFFVPVGATVIAVCVTAVVWIGCSGDTATVQSPTSTMAPALKAPLLTTFYVASQSEFNDAVWASGPGDVIIITVNPPFPGYTLPSGCTSCLNGKVLKATGYAVLLLPSVSVSFDNVSMENIGLRHSPYSGQTVSMEDSDIRNMAYQQGSLGIGAIGVDGVVSAVDCTNLRLSVHAGATANVDSCSFYGATDECSQGYTVVNPAGDLNVTSWNFAGTTYGGHSPLIVDKDVVVMSGCDWGYIRVEVADANAVVGTIFYGDNACTDGEITTTVVGNYHYAEIPISGYSDGSFYWKIRVRYCADKDWAEETSNCFKAKLTPGVPECPAPEWWP